MSTTIAVINASTLLSDHEAQAMVAAIQTQVTRDWLPRWGMGADLVFVPRGHHPPASAWWVSLMDTADAAGALGYHDITSAGLPLGKVFVKTTRDAGDKVSVTLSHEVLEMLADPDVNLLIQKGARFYAYEVCDAVEDDGLGYDIGGITVSDFVLPAFFQTFRKTGPFSLRNHVSRPLSLAPGGYLAFLEQGQWHQVTARMADIAVPAELHALATDREDAVRADYKARPLAGSRRQRRQLPPRTWLPSRVEVAG